MTGIDELKSRLTPKLIEEIEDNIPKGTSAEKIRKIYEEVAKEYEQAKVCPGESVGIISAESIGEPGTQMSCCAAEKIIIRMKNKIKIVEIGKFINELMQAEKPVKLNKHSDILSIDNLNIHVPSINQQEKIEWKRIAEVSRHKPLKKLIRLTTASGRKITATDNHSFVTRADNMIVPVLGSDLRISDRIPVLRCLPEHCTESIHVSDYIQLPSADNFRVTREYRPTKLIPSELELDSGFGWFIGAYLAEGSSSNHISISNIDDNYIENAKKFTAKIGLNYKEVRHHRGFAKSRDFIVNSSLLSRFISTSCGAGSANKKVPEFAYSAKEEFVSGLLKGYFDGDGNVAVDRKMIRVSSDSEELLDGIKLMLTRFGIFAFKSKNCKQHYLIIPYKYAQLFLEKIGSDIKYKKAGLEQLAEQAKKFWNDRSQDYTDMISGFGDLFYKTAKKLGYPTRYVNNFTKRQKIGRTALYRYMKLFEGIAEKKKIDISEELGIMRRMFNSDVIWDSIEKIEYVDYKNEYVYDLSVPGLETFTTFDGIITHNTLNTFHLAGVAEMNVTMGLPRLIEILDGRKSIETPMMEIYLNEPHRSGKGLKELAVRIKETRLGELVKEFIIDLAENAVSFTLDEEKAKLVNVTPSAIIKAIEKSAKLHAKQDGKEFVVNVTSKEAGVNEVYKLKEMLRHVFVGGVKNIAQVLPIKRGNEFIIITGGTNLKSIMEMEEIDKSRTVSNDIFEIYSMFGIEAARTAIIDEIFKVIESQGLNVDERHIMLVADMMTADGSIKGITRYGIIGEKSSVLARASFETPIKHLINAALTGERDPLNSVIENVMINQVIPIGTGMSKLIVKSKEKK